MRVVGVGNVGQMRVIQSRCVTVQFFHLIGRWAEDLRPQPSHPGSHCDGDFVSFKD